MPLSPFSCTAGLTERRIELAAHRDSDFAVIGIFRQNRYAGFELRTVGVRNVQAHQISDVRRASSSSSRGIMLPLP